MIFRYRLDGPGSFSAFAIIIIYKNAGKYSGSGSLLTIPNVEVDVSLFLTFMRESIACPLHRQSSLPGRASALHRMMAMWKRIFGSVPPPPMDSIKNNWGPGNGEDYNTLYNQDTISRLPLVTAPESPTALMLTQDLIDMVNYSFVKARGK